MACKLLSREAWAFSILSRPVSPSRKRTHQGPGSSTFSPHSYTSLFSDRTYRLCNLRAPCKVSGNGELKCTVQHTNAPGHTGKSALLPLRAAPAIAQAPKLFDLRYPLRLPPSSPLARRSLHPPAPRRADPHPSPSRPADPAALDTDPRTPEVRHPSPSTPPIGRRPYPWRPIRAGSVGHTLRSLRAEAQAAPGECLSAAAPTGPGGRARGSERRLRSSPRLAALVPSPLVELGAHGSREGPRRGLGGLRA